MVFFLIEFMIKFFHGKLGVKKRKIPIFIIFALISLSSIFSRLIVTYKGKLKLEVIHLKYQIHFYTCW